MQIYFGSEPMDTLKHTEGMLFSESTDKHAFYYGVEFGSNNGGSDEVRIYDGIDRELPVDLANVPALIEALQQVLRLSEVLQNAAAVEAQVFNPNTETHVLSV